jgi:hypothetical protein
MKLDRVQGANRTAQERVQAASREQRSRERVQGERATDVTPERGSQGVDGASAGALADRSEVQALGATERVQEQGATHQASATRRDGASTGTASTGRTHEPRSSTERRVQASAGTRNDGAIAGS